MNPARKKKAIFGDFQTPFWFAQEVCQLLTAIGIRPGAVVEPTCGLGNFLLASLDVFETASAALGAEINLPYVQAVREKVAARKDGKKIEILHADFFHTHWEALLSGLPDPLLVIGNPPWVTNTGSTILGGDNLPPKTNFQKQSGIDAITGASNFDISEWMLLQMIAWVRNRPGVVAILCKTSVARKVLWQTWRTAPLSGAARMHLFDVQAVFGVSVNACLFVYDNREQTQTKQCGVYSDMSPDSLVTEIGYQNEQLIANVGYYRQWQHLEAGHKPVYQWRSGIKHDCASVMELEQVNGAYMNQLGERCELEKTHLYPLLKSSDIAGLGKRRQRWLLVSQQAVGENTLVIKTQSPKTWRYLLAHAELLDSRKSAIYKNQPRFSIFGVGPYSFAPWKVAISGLYKRLNFVVVGPYKDKPTILDDTCYFLSCDSEVEATLIAELLNSQPATEFYSAFIFWDAKRPVTARILGKLDLLALATVLGKRQTLAALTPNKGDRQARQLSLWGNGGNISHAANARKGDAHVATGDNE